MSTELLLGHAPVVVPPDATSGVLTAHQLQRRRCGIGSSDVAAVLGLSKYRDPFMVYLDKRGLLEREPETGPQRWGHLLEAPITDAYVAELQREHGALWARPVGTVQHPEHAWALATPDRAVQTVNGDAWLLEIKTASAYLASEWGPSGTDEVPVYYAVQGHWQMLVTGMERCDVAALIGGQDFRRYTLRADHALHADLLARVGEWWQRHIVEGIEPTPTGESGVAWLASQYPAVKRDLVLDADAEGQQLLAALAQVKGEMKAAQEAEADLKARLMARIGDAKGLQGAAGRATWYDIAGRTSVDWEAVARAAGASSELIRQYTKLGRATRGFRFTPAKGE